MLLTLRHFGVSFYDMDQLQIAVGSAARTVLCDAFAHARSSIDAEFFSISDPSIIASLNDAAARKVHVRLHVEAHPDRYQKRSGRAQAADHVKSSKSIAETLRREFASDVDIVLEDHPDELMHAKAAVVDETTAYVSTANPTWSSFANPGEAVVTDALASDVKAVQAAIEHQPRPSSQYVVIGPSQTLREQVMELFHSQHDLRIASEDLSDRLVVDQLLERQALGHHDRILVGDRSSAAQKRSVTWLRHAGVQVRSIASGYMHEKYVDTGDELYVGSANLTRNGLDEAHEVGVVAPTAALPGGAQTLRDDFDANWSRAV